MLLLGFHLSSNMPDLLPIDATMIVGILIFYTIPTITKGEWLMNRFDKVVIYSVAGAVILFAISAIATIILVADIPEWCTVGGFIAIIIMVLAFTRVINIAKIASLLTPLPWGPEPSEEDATTTQDKVKKMAKAEMKDVEEEEGGRVSPEPWKDKTQDEMREEEARRKQEEELRKKKARMEPSEGYHTMWPDQTREDSSDKSPVGDAVGD
jgi:hypothetical protein